MQRWFYANQELDCEIRNKYSPMSNVPSAVLRSPQVIEPQKLRKWRFCVTVKDREMLPNEFIAVSGDCNELGNWELNSSVLMTPLNENNNKVWQNYIDIPTEIKIAYRYLIVAVDTENNRRIVRFFESHIKTRTIPENTEIPNICEDIFGYVNDEERIERGWLTTEIIVQMKFFKEPFNWCLPFFSKNTFYVKVTPYFRKNLTECLRDAGLTRNRNCGEIQPLLDYPELRANSIAEVKDKLNVKKEKIMKGPPKCENQIRSFTNLNFNDSDHKISVTKYNSIFVNEKTEWVENYEESTFRKDIKLRTAFAFNEVVNSSKNKDILKNQPRFGTPCGKDDLVTVHLTIGDFQNTVYLIELFKYSKNASKDEDPYRVGYRYVLPEDFENLNSGYMETPIICASTYRPMGTMKFGFSIIHPHPKLQFDLSISYLRYWNKKRTYMDIGHRGQGKSFYSSEHSMVHENTVYTMNHAFQNGADMVEFDVQLTKDLIPVIYHDFNIHVARHDNTIFQNFHNIDIPVSNYTYEELQNLRIYKKTSQSYLVRVRDAESRLQLFPKLVEFFDMIDEKCGFLIELKWPQQMCNRTHEQNVRPVIDLNTFVDIILEVVFQNARRRRIIFCSFDADTCIQLRFKQNRYPVILNLNQGYKSLFLDPRIRNPSLASNLAYSMELFAMSVAASTIQNYPSVAPEFIDKRLQIFVFAIKNFEHILDLKKAGVKGIIMDRIDQYAKIRPFMCSNSKHDNADHYTYCELIH